MTRREKFRFGLHPEYAKLYDALCAELPDHWQPICGVRTFAEQSNLYNQGRTMPGKVVTNAQPGTSAHNWGCASDWIVFDGKTPVWIEKSDDRWSEYAKACEKIGLVWGGNFSTLLDYPHNELKLVFHWGEVLEVFRDVGQKAADEFITRNLGKL